MDESISEWYGVLGTLNRAVCAPLGELSSDVGIPVISVLLPGPLFGRILGASLVRGWVRGVRRAGRVATVVAGVVLLLSGLNDTLVYWFL